MMVEGVGEQVHQRTAATGLGILCAVDHPLDAAVDDGPAAHGAGLQRHKQLTLPQPPATQLFAGRIDGQQLGMVQGIFLGFPGVVGHGNGFAVLGHHCAHRNLAQCGSFFCLLQRKAHQFLVGHQISPS